MALMKKKSVKKAAAAAKKAAGDKGKTRLAKARARKRGYKRRYPRESDDFATHEARKWRLWCHDVDTLLHQMVRNPALQDISAEDLISRAEKFADAYHAMQGRRRPAGLSSEADRF